MGYLEDGEKRLLFSALHREKKICEKIDKECTGKIKLKPIVERLEHKFYYDRFEKEIRSNVIDEFAEEFNLNILADDNFMFDRVTLYKIVKKTAEMMKGE